MGSSDTTSSQTSGCTEQLAEMLVHIGRTARGEETGAGLTAAQWTGLRFFARANRASRTPSAFCQFSGHDTGHGLADDQGA